MSNNLTEQEIHNIEYDLTQNKELNNQLETEILNIEDIPEDQILD
jgi:hypothetical protein